MAPSPAPIVAIIGTGPAGLMAADALSSAGVRVELYEKRKSAGRKLLVAGSSGLNISNDHPVEKFASYYTGPRDFWRHVIGSFPPTRWISFIEDLGIKTFLGTSGRYFVEDMKASRFLQAWLARLSERGVMFHYGKELTAFSVMTEGRRCSISFADGTETRADAACFCLGGGSWEPTEDPLRWPRAFKEKGLRFDEFQSSNVGYQVAWKPEFLKEAEGLPLKKIVLTSAKARREGDAMITRYGIEGTPVYFGGLTGRVHLDLRPDLSAAQILTKLRAVKENLSPIRRVRKQLSLCPASFALVFHHTPAEILQDATLESLVRRIKAFPLDLLAPQPLAEAISSSGGLSLDELDTHFMLKRFPGFFAAGEMLSWDVPTGGFLLQGSVAQGFLAAQGILKQLERQS